MKQLKIEPTSTTPFILFDREKNLFKIEGRSYPADVVPFYEPVISWLEAYVKDPNPVTDFDVDLTYVSSNSLKELLILLKMFIPLKEAYQVNIKWYRNPEDDDMQERGEFLQEMTGLNFEFLDSEEL